MDDYKYCSFDLDANSGIAQLHKCNPENTSEIMIYTGENYTECKITVFDFTDEYSQTWMARLDEDFTNTVINITIAEDVQNLEIIPEDFVLGQESKIICKSIGGKPKPFINLLWENPSNLISDFTQTFQNENGTFEYFYEVKFLPKIEDHGKVVKCQSFVFDGEQSILYDTSDEIGQVSH